MERGGFADTTVICPANPAASSGAGYDDDEGVATDPARPVNHLLNDYFQTWGLVFFIDHIPCGHAVPIDRSSRLRPSADIAGCGREGRRIINGLTIERKVGSGGVCFVRREFNVSVCNRSAIRNRQTIKAHADLLVPSI